MIDIAQFTFIFILYICIFSIEYQILGVEMENKNEEYPYIGDFLANFIQTFRNSLGDLQVPGMRFWMSDSEDYYISGFMIYLIWFMWVFNKIVMLIVLLNFLIAIIS